MSTRDAQRMRVFDPSALPTYNRTSPCCPTTNRLVTEVSSVYDSQIHGSPLPPCRARTRVRRLVCPLQLQYADAHRFADADAHPDAEANFHGTGPSNRAASRASRIASRASGNGYGCTSSDCNSDPTASNGYVSADGNRDADD